VIDNLLSNAVKFTPAGGKVDVEIGRSAGHVQLVVADTGVGMSADDLAHLFEQFHRSKDAVAAGIKGTGLGLSITKAIVEAHGGTITPRSTMGAGTSFTIDLPVAA
jgi:two-component system phosphate regulon sensor histidine kinase PhoR